MRTLKFRSGPWQNDNNKKKKREEFEKKVAKKVKGYGFGIGAVVLLLIIFAAVVVKVPAGHIGVLFDKLQDGVQLQEFNGGQEGWGLKIPFIQSVTDMDVRTQSVEYMGENAVTPKDFNGVNFKWDIVVRYKLDPVQAAEVYKTKGINYADKIIGTALRSRAREVLGNYAQENVQKNRTVVAEEIKIATQKRVDEEALAIEILKPGFLIIESVDMRDLNYHQQIEASIVTKQKQLQIAEQKVYELQQAVKEKEIIETRATAQKNKAILEAEGSSEAILLVATAKAEGIQKVNTAYQGMPMEYVQVKYAEAIKATDKVYLGFESLSGNTLGVLGINELIGSGVVKTQTQEQPQQQSE